MEAWITRGMLVDPLDKVVFDLSESKPLSDVVKSEYGYHILKRIAYEPAGFKTFNEVKEEIVNHLTEKFKSVSYKAFVAQYYPTALEFNDAAINALPTRITD